MEKVQGTKMNVKISCKQCNKEFNVKLFKSKITKFCSRNCANMFRKNKTYEEYYDEEKTKKIKNEIAKKNGYKLLRIKESEIKNKELVIQNTNKIFIAMKETSKVGLL